MVLPAGRLREFPTGAARADVVLVTKCEPTLDEARKEGIREKILQVSNRDIPVYFTRYEYGTPVNFGPSQEATKQILLVTAIANPQPLIKYLKETGYQILEEFRFPDHHAYTLADLERIFKVWQRFNQTGKVVVFTTRKDAAKLTEPALSSFFAQMPFFYVPIKVTFVENQQHFDQLILNHLATRSKPEFN
jgi:tetraacyldisaccharide 4'-kinase